MKNKLIILSLFVCIILNYVKGQTPNITWQTTNVNSNIMNSLEYTSGLCVNADGSVVLSGQSGYNYYDIINTKISKDGAIIWSRNIGEPYTEIPGKIISTRDGGYLNLGSKEQQNGSCFVRPSGSNANYYDMWVYKSDSLGNYQNQFCLGSYSFEAGYNVVEIDSNIYVAVGYSSQAIGMITSNAGDRDLWVIKFTGDGGVLWSKSYGAEGRDEGYGITKTNDGNCVIVGVKNSDAYALKLNIANGNLIWEKTFAGNLYDDFRAVKEYPSGNLYVVGTTNSTSATNDSIYSENGGYDYLVMKLDMNGNKIWSKTFGSTLDDKASDVVVHNDEEIAITGNTNGADNNVTGNYGSTDTWIVNLDYNGNLIWQKNIGSTSSESGTDILQTNDGGLVALSTTYQLYSNNDIICPKSYMWLAKLGGNPVTFPSQFTNINLSTTSSDNNIQISNWQHAFKNSLSSNVILSVKNSCVNLGACTTYLQANASIADSNLIMRRTFSIVPQSTSNGTYIRLYFSDQDFTNMQATNSGLSSIDELGVIVSRCNIIDGLYSPSECYQNRSIADSLISTGRINGFNYIEFKDNITNQGEYFIVANNNRLLSIQPNINIVRFSVFPNPTRDEVNVKVDDNIKNAAIIITDIFGKTLMKNQIFSVNTILKTDLLKPGIYFITIDEKGKKSTQKLIID